MARRTREGGLTLDRILDAALALVDRDGLDALTMRGLAGELGRGHASLYRHVASRDEVVVLLADRVLGGLRFGDGAGTPRDRAEAALRSYRAALLAHPALTPAFLDGQLLGPNALARREEGLRFLLDAGATPALASLAFLTATHFVISSAAFEASGAGRTVEQRAEMEDYFLALPPDEYPTVGALAKDLNAVAGDDEFELGLAALLDHLGTLIAGR